MSEETTPAVIELPKELVELKSTAVGLPTDKADRILMSFAPAMTALTELSGETQKVSFDKPADIDAEIAYKIRRKMVTLRTDTGKLKDSLKEDIKREDKLIMSAHNLIVSALEMKEKSLKDVEDFRAKELARLQAIKLEERQLLMEPFNTAYDPIMVGAMSDEAFATFISGVKFQHSEKLRIEKEAEDSRIENERVVKLHGERKNMLIPVWNFVDDEKKIMNFGILSEEDFQAIHVATIDKFNADKKAREDERIENERLKKEREEIEAKAKQEREAAEKKLNDEQEKARKEKEAAELQAKKEKQALEAKLATERAKRVRIEAEQRAAVVAEQKQKEAEEKAAKLAEKKAKSAPDKQKIEVMLMYLNAMIIPDTKTDEGTIAIGNIKMAFSQLVETIQMEISKL